MISVDIDSKDIGDLAQKYASVARNATLKKISGVRLENDVLAFDQNFVLGTTVRLGLSCDASGKLLIRIVSLADNEAGNAVIMKAVKAYSALSGLFGGEKGGGVAGIVEQKTDGQFVRVADDLLSLDPQDCVPFPLKLHGVSIHDGKLSLQLELF